MGFAAVTRFPRFVSPSQAYRLLVAERLKAGPGDALDVHQIDQAVIRHVPARVLDGDSDDSCRESSPETTNTIHAIPRLSPYPNWFKLLQPSAELDEATTGLQ